MLRKLKSIVFIFGLIIIQAFLLFVIFVFIHFHPSINLEFGNFTSLSKSVYGLGSALVTLLIGIFILTIRRQNLKERLMLRKLNSKYIFIAILTGLILGFLIHIDSFLNFSLMKSGTRLDYIYFTKFINTNVLRMLNSLFIAVPAVICTEFLYRGIIFTEFQKHFSAKRSILIICIISVSISVSLLILACFVNYNYGNSDIILIDFIFVGFLSPLTLYYSCAKTNSVWTSIIISISVGIMESLAIAVEQINLLYTATVYETSDVISTYVYRQELTVKSGILVPIIAVVIFLLILFLRHRRAKSEKK